MLVENQIIKVRWTNSNRKHYEKKGYSYTKCGDSFEIDAKDLTKSSRIIVRVKCDLCGKEYEMNFESYCKAIEKNGCVICQKCMGIKNAEKTLEKRQNDIYNRILNIFNEKGYILLTEKEKIKGVNSYIEYLCPKHGKKEIQICSLFDGSGCYDCGRAIAIINKNKTTLRERQLNLYNKALQACEKKGYILITPMEDIINNITIISYICPKHGEKRMRISNLINGKGYPDCAIEEQRIKNQLKLDEVEKRIMECGGVLLNKEDYINNTVKNLKILCPCCHKPFITSLRLFTQHGGQLCIDCSNYESLGEKMVKKYLESHGIEFQSQKKFDDCKDTNPLPFDFYLPKHNKIIEYDGRQHFEEVNIFTYPLELIQKHDNIKNQYCKNNNIDLIRIPYTKINQIENILNKQLNFT